MADEPADLTGPEAQRARLYPDANAGRMRYAPFRQLGMFVGSRAVDVGCEIVLAADLGDGTDDPRATAPGLLRRAGRAARGGAAPGPGGAARRRRVLRRAAGPRRPRRAHRLGDRRQADRPAVAAAGRHRRRPLARRDRDGQCPSSLLPNEPTCLPRSGPVPCREGHGYTLSAKLPGRTKWLKGEFTRDVQRQGVRPGTGRGGPTPRSSPRRSWCVRTSGCRRAR